MPVPKRPNKKIITLLNDILTAELTAINQYFLHAKMCANWGYNRLAAKVRMESIDEMKHAEDLIDRILYLGGVPNVQRLGKVTIGETVREQFELDLATEMVALKRLNTGVQLCRDESDNGTRVLVEAILTSEEDHVDWLEAQLDLMEQVGEKQYLAQQISDA